MPTCSRCQSNDCESNKIQNVSLPQLANGALTTGETIQLRNAFSGFFVWLGVFAGNAVRHDWRCRHCHWTF